MAEGKNNRLVPLVAFSYPWVNVGRIAGGKDFCAYQGEEGGNRIVVIRLKLLIGVGAKILDALL